MATSSSAPAASAPPAFPPRLGCRDLHECYVVDRFAGEGTYGKVSLGRERATGELVAIKHMKLVKEELDCFPVQALREIKCLRELSRVRHPHIINFREVVTSKPCDANKQLGDVFLVFDAAEGDLAGFLAAAAGRPPWPLVRHLMRQLLEGLAHIHGAGYVHRDVKPANLLLNRDYTLRITDFGLSKRVPPDRHCTPEVCTLWWRAPEVLLADRVRAFSAGPAIDLWAAGVVLTNVAAGPDAKGSFHCYDKPIPAAQAIWNICGSPEAGWPAVVKTPNWQAMRPQSKKIQPALRRMYGGRG
jgi:serine/threonine protein kinase